MIRRHKQNKQTSKQTNKQTKTTGVVGEKWKVFCGGGLDGGKMMSVFKWVVCWIGWTFVLGKVWN